MTAGLPPPRPDQGFAPAGTPMAPGSPNVVRARQVIVFGPSGAIVGIFVYAAGTTPGPGNPPVDSITRSSTDPWGNPVEPDFVAYGSGGAYSQLTDGVLNFFGSTGQFSPAQLRTLDVAGFLDMVSGLVTGSDVAAEFTLQSQSASSVTDGQAILNAGQFSVNAQSLFSEQVNISPSDGPFILGETFHDVSGGAGLGTVRVKLTPWNAVFLDVQVSSSSTGTFNLGTLPSSSYWPVQNRQFPLANNGSSATYPRIFIPAGGGSLQIVAGGSGAWAGGLATMYPTN